MLVCKPIFSGDRQQVLASPLWNMNLGTLKPVYGD